MDYLSFGLLVAFGLSAVVGERFYRRLPYAEGEWADPRIVFRRSPNRTTERWRRLHLASLAVVAILGLASIAAAWPR